MIRARWLFLVPLAACSAPAGDAPPAPAAEIRAPEPALAEEPAPPSSDENLAAFDAAWQSVNDSHFDPTFNGVDWAALREEFRPRAAQARSKDELRGLIKEMLERLGQSHFDLLPAEALAEHGATGASPLADAAPEGDLGTLGLDVRLREGKALVSSVDPGGPAERAGVRPGWVVERVGDHEIDERLGTLEDVPPRRAALILRQAVHAWSEGAIGSREQVVFEDGAGARVALDLERTKLEAVAHEFASSLPTFHLEFQSRTIERDGKHIGWIHFTNWFLPVVEPINGAVDRMRTCDGIVLDLRGNTGGAAGMVMGVSGNFFAEMTELGVTQMRDATVRFMAIPRLTDLEGERVVPFSGPVALLVDEVSASASEVFAGGMQSVGRARVFGETTAGAVLPATTTTLPNGDVVLHATGDFKTAQGTALEGRGVVPDEVVPLTRTDLLAGHDAPLEAALAWIAAQERP